MISGDGPLHTGRHAPVVTITVARQLHMSRFANIDADAGHQTGCHRLNFNVIAMAKMTLA
jgi:hypothetical protein